MLPLCHKVSAASGSSVSSSSCPSQEGLQSAALLVPCQEYLDLGPLLKGTSPLIPESHSLCICSSINTVCLYIGKTLCSPSVRAKGHGEFGSTHAVEEGGKVRAFPFTNRGWSQIAQPRAKHLFPPPPGPTRSDE